MTAMGSRPLTSPRARRRPPARRRIISRWWRRSRPGSKTLEAGFAKVEAAAAMHRADFERERERCERLMAEVLKGTAELMAAREAAAMIAGELAALKARPWWRRLAG
jgi:hypothetical protein